MPDFLTNDGVRLHYTDEGDGRPVVLIPGFRASAATWLFQQRALTERGFRVLSLDRRGHGESQAPAFGHRMARHGADLRDLLAATGLTGRRDVVLVGGSMGASTIWAYVDQCGTADLAGIVSVDQTPKMSNEEGWANGFYGYGADNLGTFFAAGPPADTGHGKPPSERLERFQRLFDALGLRPEDLATEPLSQNDLALLRDHAIADWRDVIRRAGVPILFVAGRDSEFWPYRHALDAAASNERADSAVIDDCGHAANIEQPEAFNKLLLGFLDTL
ncbi:alpha/beta fold hydrolase [Nocardia alni]|uniref:alpha/beta fold hydrolase n=1 Tax=Nocardia alni TaxID=2815723 RepID=UPI0027E00421|nr:alpha/beta hydrolase [Nocardia alni]